jgi:hypothetical protein
VGGEKSIGKSTGNQWKPWFLPSILVSLDWFKGKS